jgi:hypothetical protein
MPGRRAFFAKRRDTTELAIYQALVRAGAEVLRLDAVDLLVWYRGGLFLLECKSARGKVQTMRAKTAQQQALEARGWPLRYVTTPEAALQAIGAVIGDPTPAPQKRDA